MYLENPSFMRLDEIHAIVLKKDLEITDGGRTTDETIELSKILKKGALITFLSYASQVIEEETRYYRRELLIQVDGKLISSFGTDGATLNLKQDLKYCDYDSLEVRTLNSLYQRRQSSKDVKYTMVKAKDIARYDNIAKYLITMAVSLIVTVITTVAYIAHSKRVPMKKRHLTTYETAEQMIDIHYPDKLLPEESNGYKTVTMLRGEAWNNPGEIACHAWVEAEKLCIMETKDSIKKRAKTDPRRFGYVDSLKSNMYMKNMHVGLITEIEMVQGYGYILRYADFGGVQNLVFDFDTGEFIEILKEEMRIISESTKAAAEKPFEEHNGWPMMDLERENLFGAAYEGSRENGERPDGAEYGDESRENRRGNANF
jgi:hypothetical protein